MKKFIILSILVLSVISVASVKAAVTVEQVTDPEFVVNQGFSKLAAEDMFTAKNRATGKPIENLYQKNNNIFVKGWRTFWGYVDPARDEADRIHHDIKPSPSFTDL